MILITGGAGYIGSHTVVELLAIGKEILIIDNFSNSNQIVLERIKNISGKNFLFQKGDIRNKEFLTDIFSKFEIEAVIHFAGLKAVGESISKPLEYYDNNVNGTLNLLSVMNKFNVKNLIFSSSATVYGESEKLPYEESMPLKKSTNPYGQTKADIEIICENLYKSNPEWSLCMLRYFNPVGAHSSGNIGEDPKGIPNNLMPYISQVAIGRREFLSIFGNDYDTKDGTCIRDFIHVVDLAKGHLAAMNHCMNKPGYYTYNLGTGHGISVLEMVNAFSKVIGREIPFKFASRRAGDLACCYADVTKANNELKWIAEKDIYDMISDTWNWQLKNPNGYIN